MRCASSPVGRGPFSTTKAHTASPVRSSGRPTTAASATDGCETSTSGERLIGATAAKSRNGSYGSFRYSEELIVCVCRSVKKRVWPSGAALATISAAMVVPGAGPILHDHLLAETASKLGCRRASERIGRAAWRKWHDKSVVFWKELTTALLTAARLESGQRVLVK